MFKIDRRLFLGVTLMAAATLLPLNPASAELKGLEIVAPAAPGGGWDLTARAVQAALKDSGAASATQVVNIAGAGGTIGLAQFVSSKKGRGQRADGDRHDHAGRHPDQQVAGDAAIRDTDRAPRRRV